MKSKIIKNTKFWLIVGKIFQTILKVFKDMYCVSWRPIDANKVCRERRI